MALSPHSGLHGVVCTIAVSSHTIKETRQYSLDAGSPQNRGLCYFLPHTYPFPLQELGWRAAHIICKVSSFYSASFILNQKLLKCSSFLSVVAVKYPDKSRVREREFTSAHNPGRQSITSRGSMWQVLEAKQLDIYMSEQREWIQTCLCSVQFLNFGIVQEPNLGNGAILSGQIFWSSTSMNTIMAIYPDFRHAHRETSCENSSWDSLLDDSRLCQVEKLTLTITPNIQYLSWLPKNRGSLCVKAWVLLSLLVPDVTPVRLSCNKEKHRPAFLYDHAGDSVISKGDWYPTSWGTQRFPMEFASAFHSAKHKYLSTEKENIFK